MERLIDLVFDTPAEYLFVTEYLRELQTEIRPHPSGFPPQQGIRVAFGHSPDADAFAAFFSGIMRQP